VVELVVKRASKACAERRVGSSPTLETMVTEMGRKVFEKLNEQKGRALGKVMDEIDVLLKPYTKLLPNGMEEVEIPNPEVAEQYEKLNREFQEIVNEINLIDKN
jgi:division protein CdvB (Snf7/Vps24/ESCRT-III family)